jgi:enterobactin synthetase component D
LTPRLLRQSPLIDFGRAVKTAGFVVTDYEAVVVALQDFQVSGAPARAVNKRRAEFLAGRFAAHSALSELGIAAAPGRNEDGSPRWPERVCGSITHGADRALCAVAWSRELRSLGIDAERLMSERASEELRARICEDGERAVLAEALGAPEHHAVTFAFSAKESLYKCLYPFVGRFMEFHAARVVEASGEPSGDGFRGELMLELTVDWSPEFRAGLRVPARLAVGTDHVETAVLLSA